MSDQERAERPDQPEQKLPFITIQRQADGSLRVHGECSSLDEAFGMLEIGKDFFRAGFAKQAQIERVNKSGGLIHHLRGNGHL